ncbi:hypothetical protein [Streptomyces sp. NRRL F-4474]|uniref:hypothetical protein n=1 Tax=Streptomyces sp. NRRL F-4474 TaxID=1463851 RepID=UPI00131C9FD0|nr:hypothetical protein [Streptomyces sp. NRRL F-4474]
MVSRLRLAGVSAVALTVVIGLAGPASASDEYRCTAYQHIELPTSGFNTDITSRVCVWRNFSGKVRASASFSWQEGGGGKFNKLLLSTRLEKNDVMKASAVCNYKNAVNANDGGGGYVCWTPWTSVPAGGITGDAGLLYDLADDGKGDLLRNLGGSPSL